MPETEQTAGAGRNPAEPVRRRRRRRRRPFMVRFWWVLPLAVCLALAPAIWRRIMSPRASRPPLPGYISDHGKVEEEYLQFTGQRLQADATRQFDQATAFMLEGNYSDAAFVLEGAAKQIPVPAIFNDLGVLYMKIDDGAHAVRSFRDALARNHDYPPVRANLKTMHLAEAIDPVSTEVEPNNDMSHANAVWLDRKVDASIAPSIGDVDWFWFTTPPPPRDRISIEVVNGSPTLNPRLRLNDENGKPVAGIQEATKKGASLRYDFSPPPNTLYYVQVDGAPGTNGAYTLRVSALHAYDVYEPNDTFPMATRIAIGQTIDANIMDSADIDNFSFLSPVAASVSIDLMSRGDTLVPGLGAYGGASGSDFIGFAPDAKGPGGSVHYAMQVEANQLYYLKVFGENDTTGPYSLVLK